MVCTNPPLLLLLVFISTEFACAQPENEVVEEGGKLYKISLAMQHGADVIKATYPALRNASSAQAAYVTSDKSVCVFFGKTASQIILSISFDSQARIETALVDSRVREASPLEKDLYAITKEAEKEIATPTYKNYGNSHFSIIPLIDLKGKRAYVTTVSERESIITFGNDHLLSFSNDNKINKRTPIHKNLMWTETQPKEIGKDAVEAWHTHLPETGSMITATDVCTLMLNERATKWKQYSVISESLVSVWRCEADKLSLISRQKWEQESRTAKIKK
jgi:hypothetical protein